eukprot:6179822-Pleurochrysis_carterae.AAC.4
MAAIPAEKLRLFGSALNAILHNVLISIIKRVIIDQILTTLFARESVLNGCAAEAAADARIYRSYSRARANGVYIMKKITQKHLKQADKQKLVLTHVPDVGNFDYRFVLLCSFIKSQHVYAVVSTYTVKAFPCYPNHEL